MIVISAPSVSGNAKLTAKNTKLMILLLFFMLLGRGIPLRAKGIMRAILKYSNEKIQMATFNDESRRAQKNP